MGYAAYTLPDGREAGYAVESVCDADGCAEEVWRGMDALCGDRPGDPRNDEVGCRRYFCPDHADDHACTHPACGLYPADEGESCHLPAGHEGTHADPEGHTFTKTEEN